MSKGSLFLPWGYIWDYFSILLVKKEKGLDVAAECEECHMCIEGQLGQEKFEEIFGSPEFEDLFHLNLKTFEGVDLVREGKISGAKIDFLNSQRAAAKAKLHKKFFNSEYTEAKNVDYNNLDEEFDDTSYSFNPDLYE